MSRDKSHVVVINQHFPPLPGGGSLRIDAIATGLHSLAEDGMPLEVSVLTGSVRNTPSRPYTVSASLGSPIASDRPLFRRFIGEVSMGLRANCRFMPQTAIGPARAADSGATPCGWMDSFRRKLRTRVESLSPSRLFSPATNSS